MVTHDPLLRTQQVAEALGVSGSSIKRWVNKGVLPATRTVGRHRLIRLSEAVRFARTQGLPCGRLENLWVPGLPMADADGERGVERLTEALRRGDARRARSLIVAAYGSGRGAPTLADDLIRPVMERIGHGWNLGALEVYHEHQAALIVAGALTDLVVRLTQVQPVGAPLALGATPEGDPYVLPLLLGELSLREAGWEVRNLGVNLPLGSLAGAVHEYGPGLAFLSVSHLADADQFLRGYRTFFEAAEARGTAVVLGGQALTPDLRDRLVDGSFGDRMGHLVEFARRLRPAPVTRPDDPTQSWIITRNG